MRFLPEKVSHATNRDGRALCNDAKDGVVTIFMQDVDCPDCLVSLDSQLEKGNVRIMENASPTSLRFLWWVR